MMRKRFVNWSLAPAGLALLMMTQMQWAALQIVAWGGMVVTYSARSGLEAGLRETFDGQHPCPMCLAIKAAKERENPSAHFDAARTTNRLDAVRLSSTECPEPRRACRELSEGMVAFTEPPGDPPPVPPPRALRA